MSSFVLLQIIALKRKINIPTVQIAWANMFRSTKSDNSSNSIETSADKSTKEIDPLETEDQSHLKKALKNHDSIKESNITNILNRKKITTLNQPDVTASQECTFESTEKSTQESTQKPIQEATQEPTRIASNNDDLEISEVSENSIMNIKITNVTSLPPEVFASVPDVGLDENVSWIQPNPIDTSAVIKPLEKWVIPQHSLSTTMKRGIHEEGNLLMRLKITSLFLFSCLMSHFLYIK